VRVTPPFMAMSEAAVVMQFGSLSGCPGIVREVVFVIVCNRSPSRREANGVLLKVTSRMNISSHTVESGYLHYVELAHHRQAIELVICCKTTHQRVDVALLKRRRIASVQKSLQFAPLS
jgi:hypothetical protein